MYSNNCVLAVLVNGTPCNELANGSVPIPFNSEYVIRVRNKDKKRRVVAKVFVDGENVAEGGIIVNPNSYVDLEGPVDLHKRFKFVSLDSPDAVDFGKNGPNPDKSKGLIEVHFHFEKEVKTAEEHHHHHHHYHDYRGYRGYRGRDWRYDWPVWVNPHAPIGGVLSDRISCMNSLDTNNLERDAVYGASSNDLGQNTSFNPLRTCSNSKTLQDGCTVEGSYTGQSFNMMSLDYESEATVLKIFLQGFDLAANLVKPVVKPSPLRRNKSTVESVVETTDCEDAELKALREKRLALQKELERLEVESLEKAIEKLKAGS